MSRALYRKYRSTSLGEVIGQNHITRTLELALKSGSISHAYLFTGPRGVGKTSVARILAHAINGLDYRPDKDHLDIIEIDAASNRRIDDIRDLREKVHIAPVSAKYKVYIVDEVHMLTNESFNALLKTLEEPPAHAVFILATTEAHKLPATILSRTQRFHFRPISAADLLAHLQAVAKKEDIHASQEALKLIAEHSEGSARDALSLLDQLSALSDGRFDAEFVEETLGLASSGDIKTLLELMRSGDRPGLYQKLNDLEQHGVSPIVLSMQLASALRDPALADPDLYDLIERLIATPKASMPFLHLGVAMLRYAKTSPPRAGGSAAARAAPTSKSKLVAEKSLPRNSEHPAQKRPPLEPKAAIHKTKTIPFRPGDWAKVLEGVKAVNQPLYAILARARAVTGQDASLRLEFAYKLHQKKMDDQRYRQIIAQVISGLGMNCPEIISAYRPASKPAAAGESLAADAVIAMMGGGKVVDA